MKTVERTTHTIDASGKAPGRLAAEISILLQGKNRTDYVPNWDKGEIVNVEHAKMMKITGNKMTDKIYYRHSGHPGGLKQQKLMDVFAADPGEVLRRAVLRMLPKNRLRTERMKRLTIK
ncbi:50S ribosomal protein L13 [Candidatus Uhrbacteria bacterium CG10_big_fil_rev_8_21_14_0_10_50_16]|uniref:Large ribosomal subunit protein uL13 n=1 Tax=Candidatus Uhrbacteria bacterium CG10_big_fil_rev_8_21_14_0_10_50_16 TaxID=1975039 RepID=A0A2H0RND7_9BACT|nr:MAG: 50S ribosomal protein L13 [Candidatus Uhrbacteria bacterium CG10_big_fil_rev_8_21_14_0_10_50_16]